MGRFRFALVLLVVSSLVIPGWSAGHAQTSDSESECGLGSQIAVLGREGDSQIATYTVKATWCIERVYSTTTESVDDTSSSSTATPSPSPSPSPSAPVTAAALSAVEKGSEQNYEAARKKKRRRGRKKKTKKSSKTERSTRTVQRRRLVSTCMTNFQLEVVPSGRDNGVDFLGATTKETTTNGCTARSFQIQGRFGQDYIRGFPTSSRSVIRQSIFGTTLENYPLGRVGYFDFTVQFNRDGPPSCTQCVTGFEFCDLRIFDSDTPADDSCIHL